MSIQAKMEPHHVLAYANNVMMVAQQQRDHLRAAVTEARCTGEAHAAADLVGTVDAQEITPRDRRNLETVPQLARRWLVFPNEIRSSQYLDREDQLQMLYDPRSNFVQTHVAAVRRRCQDIILGVRPAAGGGFEVSGTGILGGAVEGKRPGTTPVALPNDQFEPHATTGLTLTKLIKTQERLKLDDFGLEEEDQLYCAITPRQETDLLNIAAATQTNLNAFQLEQLRTGKPTTLMGMTWIVTNRLPKVGDNRLCPVWSKRNIVLGVWEDIAGTGWNDTSANNTPFIRVSARMDCVRVQDKGVRVIECREA